MNIAAKQFASYGYHDTKISAIVHEANVTQPTFYLYFKSKDAIFQELIGIFKDKLHNHVEQSRLSSGIETDDLLQRIATNISLIFHFFQENEQVARIGLFLSEEAIEIKKQMAKQIEDNLTVEAEDGYFHTNINLSIVASAIVGVIEHFTFMKLWTGLNTPEELSIEITKLFLYGLIKEN
ncbi:TetR/AcrR family transcriptional regulator [Paenibacillus chungangensis]|uniref:TetR/AcrR family transcriptional regulator n=1 Tax=Paenibacillus chungangensis TaxID=696535 RepID=A0ABW3HRD4_9BACL